MAVKLTKTKYKEVCDCVKDLQEMKEDIERAERSGNPHIQAVKARYEHCKERLEAIKREYYPNKA